MSSSSSISPADYSLELTRQMSITEAGNQPMSYRMIVTVTNAVGIDPNIFLHSKYGTGDTAIYEFQCVCSPTDQVEYPAAAPQEDGETPFFRTAEIDLLSRDLGLLLESWEYLVSDCGALVRAWRTMDTLEVDQVEIID